MYKQFVLSFIITFSSATIFAQNNSHLQFVGEIYENTCDLMSAYKEEKCEILNTNLSIFGIETNTETNFSESVKANIKKFQRINTTFYAVNLKSINDLPHANLEISYK